MADAVRPTSLRPRLLVFIVAYNAERTLADTLGRIPRELTDQYDVEGLVIDDSSVDGTFERGEAIRRDGGLPFELHVLFNPVNQGYGGNQKLGYHYAIERGFDYVALLHADGQYAPECLPQLLEPLRRGEADAVLGSRMLSGGARAGGMPLYKYVGNRILTTLQNRLLQTHLSEFHSGYRVYAVNALRQIPFDLNTNDFHFDTEIIVQLMCADARIRELPIPTYYGDEICHVNGVRYAKDVLAATTRARVQSLGLLYDRRFDCASASADAPYQLKLGYESPHSLVLSLIRPGSRVLDLGCAGGYVGAELRRRGCHVTGLDREPLPAGVELDAFYECDLDALELPVRIDQFDYVLLLDVIEHLRSPEEFLDLLSREAGLASETTFIVSTGNVAFAPTRLSLLLGQFNYGRRGILDMTHTRLFTFETMKRLLEGARFEVLSARGVPAPFALALRHQGVAHALTRANSLLVRLRPTVFAYQIFMTARRRPSLDYLLQQARRAAAERAEPLSATA
jgi:glycosyltransferase involved in cell wall biosynthesis/SAM-dependent methyltransferase